MRSLSIKSSPLAATLEKAEMEMETALSDSFDTPRAMRIIYELVKEANIHLTTQKSDLDIAGIEKITRWITKIVGIFGLDANATFPYDGLGWTSDTLDSQLTPEENVKPYSDVLESVKASVQGLSLKSETLDLLLAAEVHSQFQALKSAGVTNPETLALPYLRNISKIRDEIRKLAPTSSSKKEILYLSDKIRDIDLTKLGVYLDDRGEGQSALIKFIPASELIAAKEEKAAKEREKAAQKEAARLAREKLEAEKAEKAKLSHRDMFRDERFSAWDEEGIPTKTKEGEDLQKSTLKKLRKDWERQKKVHEEWKAKNGA